MMSGYLGIGWDGWDQTWSEYYDGVIDSVAVWDKTLSSAEVAALYDTADKSGYHLTTKEYDTDIGLYYFFNRWYDPTVGRFTTRSPLPACIEHPYVYCENNPLGLIDPTGNKGIKCDMKCIKRKLKEFFSDWGWWTAVCVTAGFAGCTATCATISVATFIPCMGRCMGLVLRFCGVVPTGGGLAKFAFNTARECCTFPWSPPEPDPQPEPCSTR